MIQGSAHRMIYEIEPTKCLDRHIDKEPGPSHHITSRGIIEMLTGSRMQWTKYNQSGIER